MNLLVGGSLGSSMRSHFLRKVGPFTFLRNHLRVNVLRKNSPTALTSLQRAPPDPSFSREILFRGP